MNADARVTRLTLQRMKAAGEPIVSLTAYDASFARLLDEAGVDIVLVGDSLGMVIQGRDSTLPVGVDDMVYHAACVARGCERALRVVDMPFMSYATPDQALTNAARLMREGAAEMVKLEGGRVIEPVVRHLTAHGVPVCGHLGLLPQSVHQIGGYRVQGRESDQAEAILADAHALVQAGVSLLVLECIPATLSEQITREIAVPTIGIGAGPACDGQVLVLYDMLGITPGKRPRFAKDFMAEAGSVAGAIQAYVDAVRARRFPGPEHSYE